MEGPELVEAIAQYFKFTERGTNFATEARAGLTTFMVMAYIIFVNQSILTAGFGDADARFNPASLAAATALVAGIMTIAMGVIGNYPFALAAGLGINAIVAFSLTGAGLSPAGAMGVIVLEGLLVTVLVLVGLREEFRIEHALVARGLYQRDFERGQSRQVAQLGQGESYAKDYDHVHQERAEHAHPEAVGLRKTGDRLGRHARYKKFKSTADERG